MCVTAVKCKYIQGNPVPSYLDEGLIFLLAIEALEARQWASDRKHAIKNSLSFVPEEKNYVNNIKLCVRVFTFVFSGEQC